MSNHLVIRAARKTLDRLKTLIRQQAALDLSTSYDDRGIASVIDMLEGVTEIAKMSDTGLTGDDIKILEDISLEAIAITDPDMIEWPDWGINHREDSIREKAEIFRLQSGIPPSAEAILDNLSSEFGICFSINKDDNKTRS